jgi:hypothetical protein
MQHYIKYLLLLLLTIGVANNPTFAQRKKNSKQKTTASKKRSNKKTSNKKTNSKKNKPTKNQAAKHLAVVDENVQEQNATTTDNMPPKEVVVTSAFKPSLRNAAKINFIAATPYIDTNKAAVSYFIPSQNLFFSYQPVAIKPLALPYDTVIDYKNNTYIKFGYGNFASPLAEAAVSFGNGKKSMVQLFGKYYAANGNLPFQNVRQTQLKATTIRQFKNQHEFNANLSFNNSIQYRYGIGNTQAANFTNEQLQQNYSAVNALFLLAKKQPNSNGLSYKPSVAINYFNAAINNKANEVQVVAKAPFTKTFNKMYSLNMGAEASFTNTNGVLTTGNTSFSNNLYSVYGNAVFTTPTFTLQAGIAPTWDNGAFAFLPDIAVTAKLATDKDLSIIAGWKGYFVQNTLQTLTTTNPFIVTPNNFTNTKFIEQYAGIKGALGKHFTVQGKVALLKTNNMPLFANSLIANNTQNFEVLNETNLNIVRIHGEVGYTVQEKLWLLGSVTFNQFAKIESNIAPYGLLPLEINATGKWKLLKDLLLKADMYFIDGNNYRSNSLSKGKLEPGVDVNAGVEFTAFPKTNLWLQFNNLFNNTYQRWHQYNVFGFQVQAGFVYSFK